jgi:hypothetical protein
MAVVVMVSVLEAQELVSASALVQEVQEQASVPEVDSVSVLVAMVSCRV